MNEDLYNPNLALVNKLWADGEEKVNILIIDKQIENLLAVETLLNDSIYNFAKATSSREALKYLINYDFAVILLDAEMPIMNGFELAELIRQREKSRYTPIIFLITHSTTTEQIHKAYDVGIADFINNPIDPKVLKAKVGVYTDLFKKTERIKKQANEIRQMEQESYEQERRQTVKAVHLVEMQWKAIFERSAVAIAIMDEDGQLINTNPALHKMLGYSGQELCGMRVSEITYPRDFDVEELLYKEIFEKHREFYHLEKKFIKQNGEAIWGNEIVSIIPSFDGKPLFAIAVIENITERKRVQEELHQERVMLAQHVEERTAELRIANEKLIIASKHKDNFLASMSHELRTPLSAVIGFTEILLMNISGPLTQKQEDQLKVIKSNAKHLLSLINDLLDLSKIEAGKTQIHIEEIVCQEIIQDVINRLSSLVIAKNIELESVLPQETIAIMTDQRSLTQILINLVNNAIKFTENGKISVFLSQNKEQQSILTKFTVADTGIGIKPEDQVKLFQLFGQIYTKLDQEGTGMGLYLSQKLANLLGGYIEYESEYGKGSKFTLVLSEAIKN